MNLTVGMQSYLEWTIFPHSLHSWDLRVKFDLISILFVFIVSLISFRIFIYSLGYIKDDKEKIIFFVFLVLFALSIIFFILSFNLSSILLGWDGLGVTSFLLVCYFHSKKSINSRLITFMVNRIGDLLIIISIRLFLITHSWNLRYSNIDFYSWSILLIVASFRKRAQLPFSNWLPKAIAAPTPVSSLVHSSTLVTAGVYLIFRLPLFSWDFYKNTVTIISSLTLIFRRLLAVSRFDLKEIIAFSTLSHVSLIVLSLSGGMHQISFFHLCVHAIFKALLFISRGYLIYLFSTQDIRKLFIINFNGLIKFSFTISVFSIMGLIFLARFYSKDFIVENSFLFSNYRNMIFYFSIFFTSAYSIRLLSMLNINCSQSAKLIKEKDWIETGTTILRIFCLLIGPFIQWLIFPINFVIIRVWNKFLIYYFLVVGRLYHLIFKKIVPIRFNFYFIKLYYINFRAIKNKKIMLKLEKGWLILILKTLTFYDLRNDNFNQKNYLFFLFFIVIFLLW